MELKGDSVTLIPLLEEHAESLVEAASDGKLWNLWFTNVPSSESINVYIKDALTEKNLSRALPFAVVHNSTNNIIGSTRFCNADCSNCRVEIGYTWYAKRYQRSSVNTECKYLLLGYAFDQLSAIAVEFRTHWHNHASRNAI